MAEDGGGQLSIGQSIAYSYEPVPVGHIDDIEAIAAGYDHSMALDARLPDPLELGRQRRR